MRHPKRARGPKHRHDAVQGFDEADPQNKATPLRPLQRQKLILNHFKPHIAANVVHALDLKCMTPAQAETAGDTVFHPHAGGTGIHIRRRPPKEE